MKDVINMSLEDFNLHEWQREKFDALLAQEKEELAKQKKQAEEFRNSILEEKKAFGEIDLDKLTRQRVYDSVMKPIYTDPETGEKYTAIQKYEMENKTAFLKNVGLLYVLTDGFTKIDKLVQGKVSKEMKKNLRELEHTISNTSRDSRGNLSFISGVGDINSKSTKWDLDL